MMTKTDHTSTTSHNHLNNKGHTKPETFKSDAGEEGIEVEAEAPSMIIVDNNEDSVEEDTIEDGYTYTKSSTSTWTWLSGKKILKCAISPSWICSKVVAGIGGCLCVAAATGIYSYHAHGVSISTAAAASSSSL